MEIAVRSEPLADERRTDDAVTVADQAPVRLRGKQQLAETGERERIGDAEQGGEEQRQDERRTQCGGEILTNCEKFLQARPRPVTARSMSLMPTNGATSPPSP